jgi:glycosyltransferase involved in cell wall biosynthesis
VRPRVIAVPYTKHSWLRRLWLEWHEFHKHSRDLRPDLWVSLHDISPNVGPARQAVYCHNPTAFFDVRPRDVFFEPSLLLFRLGYGWLYRTNLSRNRAVIVQQAWLREEFRKWVKAPTEIIVAHPVAPSDGEYESVPQTRSAAPATFLYPALPRAFKNVELLCRAVEQLDGDPRWQSQLVLTIAGTENRYGRWLKKTFGKLRTIRFAGRQSREQMQRLYAEADCLLFPSRMETWGLPITEAKQYRLPMFVADLPYARETVGSYPAVEFFDIDDYRGLARKLQAFQQGQFQFQAARADPPQEPFAADWGNLVRKLTSSVA